MRVPMEIFVRVLFTGTCNSTVGDEKIKKIRKSRQYETITVVARKRKNVLTTPTPLTHTQQDT